MITVITPLLLNLDMPHANRITPGDLRARHLNQRRLAIIFRSGGVEHFWSPQLAAFSLSSSLQANLVAASSKEAGEQN